MAAALTSSAWPLWRRSWRPQHLLVGDPNAMTTCTGDLGQATEQSQGDNDLGGKPQTDLRATSTRNLTTGGVDRRQVGQRRESFRYASRREATHFCIFSLLKHKMHLYFASSVDPEIRGHSAPRSNFRFAFSCRT
jgi:hypothetical protein